MSRNTESNRPKKSGDRPRLMRLSPERVAQLERMAVRTKPPNPLIDPCPMTDAEFFQMIKPVPEAQKGL